MKANSTKANSEKQHLLPAIKTNATMKQKIILSLLTFAFATITTPGQTKNDTLVFGLKNVKIYKESVFSDFSHIEYYTPKQMKAKLKPTFMIRFESQVGISIRPTIVGLDSYASRFLTQLNINDTYGKNFLQMAEYDFDKDGISELVISFGVRGSGLLCFIYKYHEPANASDATRDANWEQIGKFENGYHDPKYVSAVTGNKIYFPFGSQGASEGFVYVDNKFVKIQ
jgi:hypothetical protein